MLVLVAPDERDGVAIRQIATRELGKQVAGRQGALLGRVCPVLQPHLLVEPRVVPTDEIAGGVDPGVPNGERPGRDDAVTQLQSAALEPSQCVA